MGGIALTILGVAWWCPWKSETFGAMNTLGCFLGLGCAVAGVICAFLGY